LAKSSPNAYPYTYGLSDLSYYGSFFNVAAYGSCWQPYFTGIGWDPFMDGVWMFDPRFGYVWVSSYPWGWMPYHYGSWMYAGGGLGWCWLPGNAWIPYYVPVVSPPPLGPPRGHKPPHPPAPGGGRFVPVGRGPTTSTLLASNAAVSTLVVKPGDAGLSIPRGVRNLKGINREFVQHGQVTLRVLESRSSSGNVAAMPRVSLAGSPASSMGHVGSGSSTSAHVSTPLLAPAPSPSAQASSAPHK
jgi:hypothetical protein